MLRTDVRFDETGTRIQNPEDGPDGPWFPLEEPDMPLNPHDRTKVNNTYRQQPVYTVDSATGEVRVRQESIFPGKVFTAKMEHLLACDDRIEIVDGVVTFTGPLRCAAPAPLRRRHQREGHTNQATEVAAQHAQAEAQPAQSEAHPQTGIITNIRLLSTHVVDTIVRNRMRLMLCCIIIWFLLPAEYADLTIAIEFLNSTKRRFHEMIGLNAAARIPAGRYVPWRNYL
jgi:hypothetical protein